MSGEQIHMRCAPGGHLCEECTARTDAGLLAIHVLGEVELGQQLLATARRIAELHNYGQPFDEHPAS